MGIRTKEHYKFQNRVMEELERTKLSPNESKYCWVLFRETCGYGDYKIKISRDRISDLTHISITHVSDVERRLKERNIIIVNSKYKGFNPDIAKWEKVQLSGHFKKVQVSGLKGPGRAEKKGPGIRTLLTKKKKDSKEGGLGLKKRSRKEIEKLEGKEWLRATMIELEGLPKEGTDEFLSMGNFTDCYNAWLELQDAYGIRNKISWLIAKIRRGPAPEE
ncbi:hypothetical protein ES705_40080 [subsurface metagenome]